MIKEDLEKFLLSIDKKDLDENIVYYRSIFLKYFPEFREGYYTKQEHPYHIYTVGDHTMYAIANSKKDRIVRVALAMHDMGKPICKTIDEKGIAHFYGHPRKSAKIAEKILEKYKYNDDDFKLILKLICEHDRQIEKKSSIRKLLKRMTIEEIELLLEVKIGDANGQNPDFLKSSLFRVESIREKLQEVKKEIEDINVMDLDINGEDLIKLGVKKGKDIGIILNILVEVIKNDITLNNKCTLMKITEYLLKKLN